MLRMLTGKVWGAVALGAVMVLASPVWAADAVGTWDFVIQAGDGDHLAKLVIAEDMTGKMVWGGGEVDLRNVKFEDGTLSFDYTVPYQGEDLDIEFQGNIEGDKLAGGILTDIGEAPASASRSVTVTAVGTWNYIVEAPGGILQRKLVITKDMKGKLITDNGEIEVYDIELKGTTLTFFYTVELGGEELDVDFQGEIDGDKFMGGVSTAMGDAGASGTRVPSVSLPGSWEMDVDAGEEFFTITLIIAGDMTIEIVGPEGDWEARNVALDGNTLTFMMKVTGEEGESFEAAFEGTVDGDGIEGGFHADDGEATATAKRTE